MKRKIASSRRSYVSASEIASYVYCPEQWRLQYGQGHQIENAESVAKGKRFHREKIVAVRAADKRRSTGCLVVLLSALFVLLLVITS